MVGLMILIKSIREGLVFGHKDVVIWEARQVGYGFWPFGALSYVEDDCGLGPRAWSR